MGDLFQELKRRNIFKVGAAYVILGWLVLQVGSVLAPILNLPEVILSVVVFFLLLGFPMALLLAWAFELTPDGIKKSTEVNRSSSVTNETGRKLNILTSSLLAAVIVLLIGGRFLPVNDKVDGSDEVSHSAALGERSYESIAVLPFVNMSDDKQQEYFSDGISEELLNLLAKTKGLRVAARTSSFAYKGDNQNIKKIGEDLDVETVLEGSVRKADATLRVTAQLIDVDTGFHLWSETYDRELKDVFKIQDEISAAIVGALQVHFGGKASEAPQQSYEPNMVAYEHYLKGQELIKKRTRADIEAALEEFTKSIEADAKFAPAYSGKADAYLLLSDRNGAYGDIPIKYAAEFAEPLIDLALELDPDLPEAHNSLGFMLSSLKRDEEALRAFDRAIELSPSLAIAHMWRSQLLDEMLGEVKGAPALEQAYRLDPMSPLIVQNLASRMAQLRNYDRATYLVNKLEEIAPEKVGRIAFVKSLILVEQREYAEAYKILATIEDDTSVARNNLALAAFNLNEEDAVWSAGQIFWISFWQLIHGDFDGVRRNLRTDPRLVNNNFFQTRVEIFIAIEASDFEGVVSLYKGIEPDVTSESGPLFQGNPDSWDIPEYVLALQELGRNEEAAELILKAENLARKTIDPGFEYTGYLLASKLAVLKGDKEEAVRQLKLHRDVGYLSWTDRSDPILRRLDGHPEFVEMFIELYDELNDEREELGWRRLDPAEYQPNLSRD